MSPSGGGGGGGGAPLDVSISWLSKVHDAIKAAQEVLRRDKKLGSGLACRVLLELPAGGGVGLEAEAVFLTFFDKAARSGELSAMYVVSGVEVVTITESEPSTEVEAEAEAGAEAFSCVKEFRIDIDIDDNKLPDGRGRGRGRVVEGRVRVLPPNKGKCPRCWRYEVEKSKVVSESKQREGEGEGEGEDKPLCGRCEDVVKDML